jgi:hypothetical protein
MLGSIRPSFFLLPLRQGEKLGVPMYEERLSRQKRDALQIGNWKGKEWLPSESSSTMVLPLGQKMGLGVITPIYI